MRFVLFSITTKQRTVAVWLVQISGFVPCTRMSQSGITTFYTQFPYQCCSPLTLLCNMEKVLSFCIICGQLSRPVVAQRLCNYVSHVIVILREINRMSGKQQTNTHTFCSQTHYMLWFSFTVRDTVKYTQLTNATSKLTGNLVISSFCLYLLEYTIKFACQEHNMDL